MKSRFFLFWALTVLNGGTCLMLGQDSMQSERGGVPIDVWLLPSSEANLNEVVKGNLGFSGVAVDLVTADNPLQLINPFAPTSYSSPEDNTLRDPLTGRAEGIKLFSIRF